MRAQSFRPRAWEGVGAFPASAGRDGAGAPSSRAQLTDGSVLFAWKKKATVTALYRAGLVCADAAGAPHRDLYTAGWRDPAHFVLRADPVDGVMGIAVIRFQPGWPTWGGPGPGRPRRYL